MAKVLIIEQGGVGTVVAHKAAKGSTGLSEILLASRTKSKCDSHCPSRRPQIELGRLRLMRTMFRQLVDLFRALSQRSSSM